MKIEDFTNLYYTHSLKELTKILNCSVPTIYNRIEELGITKKGQGKGKRSKRKLELEQDNDDAFHRQREISGRLVHEPESR